jgi:cold shock CspA family protein
MFGTITRVSRGYGFIRANGESGREVFFHGSSLCGGLVFSERLVGERIDFDFIRQGHRDRRGEAVNVRPVEFLRASRK